MSPEFCIIRWVSGCTAQRLCELYSSYDEIGMKLTMNRSVNYVGKDKTKLLHHLTTAMNCCVRLSLKTEEPPHPPTTTTAALNMYVFDIILTTTGILNSSSVGSSESWNSCDQCGAQGELTSRHTSGRPRGVSLILRCKKRIKLICPQRSDLAVH